VIPGCQLGSPHRADIAARERTAMMIDILDDWLYLPEILYAFMLIMIVSAGAGPYSLDAVIVSLIDKHGA
jgi:hypothetical protein